MRTFQAAVLLVGQTLLLLTLTGLWRRRRLNRVWLLPLHLAAAAIVQTIVLTAPDTLRAWNRWATVEILLLGLALGIVAEIAGRVFANLPHARRHARRLLALALLLPLALLLLTPWHSGDNASASWLYIVVTELLPRLSYGAGFVCLALGWAMTTHRIPFDKLHWPVLIGLGCYLFIYSISLGLQRDNGPTVLVYIVTPVAYTLMIGWWAWAAWRHEEPDPDASDRARRLLHPWNP